MKRQLPPQEMFPAGETGYRVRDLRLSNECSVRIVECGDQAAPPVILLHGWGCSAFAFHKNIIAIAAAGFHVVAPDLQGHGLSDKPVDASKYNTAAMVQHVGLIADALDIRRFAIAGHSMGAALALRFTIANPRRICAMALLAPVGTSGLPFLSLVRLLSPRGSLPVWRILNTRWMTHFFLKLAYGKFGTPTEREVAEYWAPSQFSEFTTALRNLLHVFNWGPFYVGGLDAYDIPMLVLSGSRDHLCRTKTRQHLKKALRTDPVVIEGAGHLVISETPDRVNAAVVGLFKSPLSRF